MDLTVYNVLMERSVTARDAIISTKVPNIDLLPANIDLSVAVEVQLVNEVARVNRYWNVRPSGPR